VRGGESTRAARAIYAQHSRGFVGRRGGGVGSAGCLPFGPSLQYEAIHEARPTGLASARAVRLVRSSLRRTCERWLRPLLWPPRDINDGSIASIDDALSNAEGRA